MCSETATNSLPALMMYSPSPPRLARKVAGAAGGVMGALPQKGTHGRRTNVDRTQTRNAAPMPQRSVRRLTAGMRTRAPPARGKRNTHRHRCTPVCVWPRFSNGRRDVNGCISVADLHKCHLCCSSATYLFVFGLSCPQHSHVGATNATRSTTTATPLRARRSRKAHGRAAHAHPSARAGYCVCAGAHAVA